MSTDEKEYITTAIWREEAEPGNPYAASRCICAGFDVYGDLLGKVSIAEYLFLLFKLEPPSQSQAALLNSLAVVLANPGPRDHSVRAAMNAGVGGSTAASALMAALAVGAGNLGGGREIYKAVEAWGQCGCDLESWRNYMASPQDEPVDVWLPMEHVPGFDPHGTACTAPVLTSLEHLAALGDFRFLRWLRENRLELERQAGCPLAISGVAAAAMADLELAPDQGEMLHLLLRLPGAAVHAL